MSVHLWSVVPRSAEDHARPATDASTVIFTLPLLNSAIRLTATTCTTTTAATTTTYTTPPPLHLSPPPVPSAPSVISMEIYYVHVMGVTVVCDPARGQPYNLHGQSERGPPQGPPSWHLTTPASATWRPKQPPALHHRSGYTLSEVYSARRVRPLLIHRLVLWNTNV